MASRVDPSAEDLALRDELRQGRVDLVKRLFAVAISVGFATQITRIFFQTGQQLSLLEALVSHWKGLSLLMVSMFGVVGSWIGYLKSIYGKPLDDSFRFYLDIVIVFAYMVWMLSSDVVSAWYQVLAVIFVLYFTWDIGSMWYVAHHKESRDAGKQRKPYQQSIAITVFWGTCAFVLAFLRNVSTDRAYICAALAALAIVLLYRFDKDKRWSWGRKAIYAALPLGLVGIGFFFRA